MTLDLWTIDIPPTQLANCLLTAVGDVPSELAIMEIEWWDRPVEMLYFSDGLDKLQQRPTDSPRGSAFGLPLEIRWRKVSENLRLAIISETPLPGLSKANPQYAWKSIHPHSIGWDGETKRERTLLLWGSGLNSDNTWSELRIGRPLAYPVIPEQKGEVSAVELKIVEYLNSSGQVVLARRAGVQARLGKVTSQNVVEVNNA